MSEGKESKGVFTPGPEAKPDPYWGIMEVDDEGLGTGNFFTHSRRLLLFESDKVAIRLLDALTKQDEEHSFAVRGITKPHLKEIVKIGHDNELELWVVTKIEDDGNVVARPLEEVEDAE